MTEPHLSTKIGIDAEELAGQTFGYIERNVKLAAVDHMIPAEVYDPRLRTAAEMRLGAAAAVQASPEKHPLTIRQMRSNQ